jgi:intraflagellar transport protein 57
LQDIPTDFPSNKLIVGAGPICIYIMDALATQAMKLSKLVLQKTQIQADDETQLELLENDSEIVLEKVEDEQNAMLSGDDSDTDHNSLLDLKFNNPSSARKAFASDFKVDSLTDSENWRLELERVLPNLKIVIKSDPRDWRAHLEQMKNLKGNIEVATNDAQSHLTNLQQDITYVMEKLDSREKHLNNDFKNLIQKYKQVALELKQVNAKIKDNEQEKAEKEQELQKVTNEVENIKIQMEQRGTQMTDGSPLINIKKAILRLKEEIAEMDVKIGVMEHGLNADIIRQRGQFAELDSFNV